MEMKRAFTLRLPQSESMGFTLIELLVVIGILGVLSGVVIAAINPQKNLADADAVRIRGAAAELQKALSQYQIDEDILPPEISPGAAALGRPICSEETNVNSLAPPDCLDLKDYLVPTYLVEIPQDPLIENYSGYRVYLNEQGNPGVFSERLDGYGLALWLDASDQTFNNSNCTTPALPGTPVNCWGDKSGWGNNMEPQSPGSGCEPYLGDASGICGWYNVHRSNFQHDPWKGFTISFYGELNYPITSIVNSAQISTVFSWGNACGGATLHVLEMYFAGQGGFLCFDIPAGNHHYAIRYNPETPYLDLFIDGNFVTQGNLPAGSPINLPTDTAIGNEGLGVVGEIHLFTKSLSDADIVSLWTYINSRPASQRRFITI